MLKKEITYDDLDGNAITETFWFNLSKAELAEMAIGKEGAAGGFDAWLKKLIESNDGDTLVATFKDILLKTIGERSDDNKRFIKSDEIRNNFLYSDAYSVLFMELMTDADKMAAFVNGIVPASMRDEVAAQTTEMSKSPSALAIAKGEPNPNTPTEDDSPAWLREGRIPTNEELKGATPEQIQEAFRRRAQGAGPVTQEQTAQ